MTGVATLPARKWAMQRLATGDYVCVSNDESTLWRFHTYVDGKISGLVVNYEARTFWRAIYMPMRVFLDRGGSLDELPDRWEAPWVEDAWHLPTRGAAIERMLRHEARS